MTEPHDQHDPAAALLRLQVAIDQLVQPERHELDRDEQAARGQLLAADTEIRGHLTLLRWRRDDALAHGRPETVARLLGAMRAAGAHHRARRRQLEQQLAVDSATLPSLIEQLNDAITSTGGAGNGSRGVYRSPLNSTAVEILADIRSNLGLHARHRQLADALRDWCPADPQAADHAERWVVEARAVVTPARWMEASRPCPACGTRRVWITEDGQRIRKSAIQVNLTDGYAACSAPGCIAWWPRERFDLLAAALQQEDVPC